MKISVFGLQGVPETLLFPLYLRYRESRKASGSIKDERYRAIVEKLDYDFRELEEVPDEAVLSIAFRTNVIDNLTRQFVESNPDGTVVSLASGLDFRHERVGNEKILWFDIDLPPVIAVRRQLFEETDWLQFIQTSVLDPSWINRVSKAKPVLFIAEGLFMYLASEEVKDVFTRISKNFTNAEMVFDVVSPFALNTMRLGCQNRFVDRMHKGIQWAMTDWSELESWDRGIQFIREHRRYCGYLEEEMNQLAKDLEDIPGSAFMSIDERAVRRVIDLAEDAFKVGHMRLGSKS